VPDLQDQQGESRPHAEQVCGKLAYMDERDERVKFMAKLPPDLHHRLKVAAAERSVNMNDLVCDSIETHLAMLSMGKVMAALRPEGGRQ